MKTTQRGAPTGAALTVAAVLATAAVVLFPLPGASQATPPGAAAPQPAIPPPLSAAPPEAMGPPPLPQGPAPDLDLVFTAEVTGWIEPCG